MGEASLINVSRQEDFLIGEHRQIMSGSSSLSYTPKFPSIKTVISWIGNERYITDGAGFPFPLENTISLGPCMNFQSLTREDEDKYPTFQHHITDCNRASMEVESSACDNTKMSRGDGRSSIPHDNDHN